MDLDNSQKQNVIKNVIFHDTIDVTTNFIYDDTVTNYTNQYIKTFVIMLVISLISIVNYSESKRKKKIVNYKIQRVKTGKNK